MKLKVEVISNVDMALFKENVNKFISGVDVVNIQYSTEIIGSKIVHNGMGSGSMDVVKNEIRHYAMIQYKDRTKSKLEE